MRLEWVLIRKHISYTSQVKDICKHMQLYMWLKIGRRKIHEKPLTMVAWIGEQDYGKVKSLCRKERVFPCKTVSFTCFINLWRAHKHHWAHIISSLSMDAISSLLPSVYLPISFLTPSLKKTCTGIEPQWLPRNSTLTG